MPGTRLSNPPLQASQSSLQDALRRALRDETGRAALRVAPGGQPEAQRLVYALLREAADVKGGSLLEVSGDDWLLTELPSFDAEKLQQLLAQILGGKAVQLLPLPASKQMLAGILNAPRPPQFLDVPAAEVVSPLDLHLRLDRLDLAQVWRRQSIVGITDTRLPRLVFQRLALERSALRQHLGTLAEDRALVRHAEMVLQRRVLEGLGDEGSRKSLMGGGPIAPLLLDLPPELLPAPSPETEEGALPAAPGLYAILSLRDAISMSNLAAQRQAFRDQAWGIGISGLSASALSLIEADELPADWLILQWSPALEDTQTLKALRRLDPSRLILDGCNGGAAFSWGLGQGINLFGGPWIEDMIAAIRMEYCSHAKRCLRTECRARGLATSFSGRLGCHNPPLLESALPGSQA